MSIDENRNCGCNDNNNENYLNNNMYNMSNDCGCQQENTINCDTKEEMLQQIKSYNFSIIELALYLDTHPDDDRALALHRRYCKELKELKDKYQKVYGPLSIYFPCNKWRWLEEPWVSFCLEIILQY